MLAKELATLDRLSGGRVELGLGVGWMKEEFDALGVPWERRGARNDEYVAAMRALWAGPHAEFHGEFVDFPPVTCSPRPVQRSIPILVGGDTDAAIQRAVRLADGYFPGEGDADRLAALIRRVREAAERAGRDPASIEINAMFGQQMADPVGRRGAARRARCRSGDGAGVLLRRPGWPRPPERVRRAGRARRHVTPAART